MEKELANFKVSLGKRIAQLRESKNIKQHELASMLDGRDKQFINRYEKGGANPTAYLLLKISKALKVNVGDLFDFEELD
ncbi:helix-turn-helix transcriptional regulator [Mucilaginibacter sp. PAMB04274]|uniref:helix-turn-helix domain-containing protein n=1 Tax=Mucilaginibacter sp. PAMB04274 TaxID=3138568 RepID=UPI0031F65FAF